MISFILISDKFSEPSTRVAKGGSYEDDDDFNIMNFQIEQWRQKAVSTFNFSQPTAWQAAPSTRPPWWTIVLYLRANSVRGLLLRPFFFPSRSSSASSSSSSNSTVSSGSANSNAAEAGKRNISPGLELVSDTINMLSTLDRTTDLYRRQHPHFQHLLASACALLFLIVAFVEQNRVGLTTSLPEDFAGVVKRNFRKAFSLAAAYSNSSRASRRLWNRLLMLAEPLSRLGILPQDEMTIMENDIASRTVVAPIPDRSFPPSSVYFSSLPAVAPLSINPLGGVGNLRLNGGKGPGKSSGGPAGVATHAVEESPLQATCQPLDIMESIGLAADNTAVSSTAWTGTTLHDWPWTEVNNFFSDRGP